MAEENKTENQTPEKKTPTKDSFDVPVEKSPWLVYAMLQIPLVIIMVLILYFMYQSRQS